MEDDKKLRNSSIGDLIKAKVKGSNGKIYKVEVGCNSQRHFKIEDGILYVDVLPEEYEIAKSVVQEINSEKESKENIISFEEIINNANGLKIMDDKYRGLKIVEPPTRKNITKPKSKRNKFTAKKRIVAIALSAGIALGAHALAQLAKYKGESLEILKENIVYHINKDLETNEFTIEDIKVHDNSMQDGNRYTENFVVKVDGLNEFTYRIDNGQMISNELNEDLIHAIQVVADEESPIEQKNLINEIKENPEKFKLNSELVKEKAKNIKNKTNDIEK